MIPGAVSVGELVSIHERDAIYAVYRADIAAERRRSRWVLVGGIMSCALLGCFVGNEIGQCLAYTRAGCVQVAVPGPAADPHAPVAFIWHCTNQPSAPGAFQ